MVKKRKENAFYEIFEFGTAEDGSLVLLVQTHQHLRGAKLLKGFGSFERVKGGNERT